MMETTILFIDDDLKLLDLLCHYFQDYHYKILTATNGTAGINILNTDKVDLIILDIMLPGQDGFEICRQIRSESDIPIIMLTARGDELDRIVGLELGADDYLPKPFNPRELLARIKAVLRRQTAVPDGLDRAEHKQQLVVKGPFQLDKNRRIVSKDGTTLSLTTVEFNMLSVFLHNIGIVLSRDRLLDLVRDRDYLPFDRSIDVHISRLRQKIEVDPKKPHFIKTVWGVGYVFTVE
ncbi:response regulator [candidate division CSSED10-310 bacterium]|uniref:Response regulator n=1 Tax=candidate division CSSED10-310 bacterium TaxID=2855610 RepID=A0ABV6YZY9_UNCC1